MIEREHQSLSVSRQCRLLGVSRSTLYYRPLGESAATLELMRRIDELYLKYPFYGKPSDGAPSGARGGGGWSAPSAAADAAVGVGSDLPQAAHQRRQPGAPGCIPICCGGLRLSDRIRCGARTSPTSRCRAGFLYLVAIMDWASRRGAGVAVVQHDGHRVSAWRRWRRRWKATAFRRSSTPIRAASSPVSRSLDCWRPRVYAVRWTVAVGVWTTCSSNGCGAP